MSPVIQSVLLAVNRSSASAKQEMGQGLNVVATITVLAPWVGLLGTAWGIVDSFHGCGGERSMCMAAIVGSLSEAIWFTAVGLVIGLLSLWLYRYLKAKLETIDQEMKIASLELVNYLSRNTKTLRWDAEAAPVGRPMFCPKSGEAFETDAKRRRAAVFFSASALTIAWFLQAVHYYGEYWVSSSTIPVYALIRVAFTFGFSFLPVYPIWVKLLHRRRGWLIGLSAVVCLAWNSIDLMLGGRLP